MSDNSQPLHLLLVENSRTARAVLTKFLEQAGYKVTAVANGIAAIEGAKTGEFDVIVMDLFMPQMNGYEAAKKIRQLPDEAHSKVPILALTASQEAKDRQICEESGMDAFIQKSDDNKALLESLAEYQQKKST